MIRKSQLITLPQQLNHYRGSVNGDASKIHVNETQFADQSSEEDDELSVSSAGTISSSPTIDSIHITGEFVTKQSTSFLTLFKTFFHKLSLFSFGSPVPTNSPDNGPFQPFADRAICLSNYGIVGRGLGQGTSSHVYLLRKTIKNKSLAVKMFRKCKKNVSRRSYMESIISEFGVTYTLRHQNILRTHDFVKLDNDYDKFALIIDYCNQGDVSTLISHRTLKLDQINALFKQLLNGLKYMHEKGVAHRDLKPENLLLHNNILKIADFGSCDVFRAEGERKDRKSYGVVGTTPYIAPEVFNYDHYWGSAADVWSAGIVFFALHCANVPFESATIQDSNFRQYLQSRRERKYMGFNEIPHKPRSLLYHMLNPNCNKRITVEGLLENPWVRSLSPDLIKKSEL
ncbi:hypothetical protein RO3G_12238 [Rhizopus delemar RA 99-880]|uniref:Protein kinase domain-containing protein n=1 Tax=Rhizopus delemar (strain RA 99-880 / ATCC MYA-4621 / FGSC 9543 / NRRL 43880) TaxID=246409 RepID=I1CGE7_RHIO9|nr:hypothetical protein RO3G_12238 [Rhizopus delemar RA 99-880]|eukprot:EIE87527.1 hypothetical protein RO3G_12238 [Rhizopus delemar RA 99-880]